MGKPSCSTAFAALAIGAAAVITVASVPPVIVALTATALFMGGTGHPLSVPQDTTDYISTYVHEADTGYVAPSGLCIGGSPGCAPVAVYTPEQFKLDTGLWDMPFDESVQVGTANLDACLRGVPCTVTRPPFTTTGPPESLTDSSYVVYGYSQSATIAAYEKYDLIAHPPAGTTVSFVLTSNPNRPNGGILERFVGVYLPIIGVSFDGAMTTNSPQPNPLMTVDVARQYDPVSDFPTNPLNLLADLNVALGFLYFHPETAYFAVNSVELQGQYQDTTYYLAPATTLPLLMPLEQIPLIGAPLAATLDPPLRVLVEMGYDRTINPGSPTPADYLYFPNPIKAAIDFLVAIPTGWDNGIAVITGDPANRPFRTTPQPTYGVGGPPVDTGAVDPYGPPTPYTPAPPSTAATRTTIGATGMAGRARGAAAVGQRHTVAPTPAAAGRTAGPPTRSGSAPTVRKSGAGHSARSSHPMTSKRAA